MGFLFGKPKIKGDERRQCLDYLEEELKIAAFDQKERKAFENAMAECAAKSNAYQITSQEFQKEISQAINRLAQAARETIRRRDKMTAVPNAAFSTYSAWSGMYSAYSAWATEQAAQEAKDAKVLIPNVSRGEMKGIRDLFQEYEKYKTKAAKEHHRLLKRLGLSDKERQELLSKAASIEAESWQPKKSEET